MILNIFILILAIETIAKRPPQTSGDGGPVIKHKKGYRPPDGCDHPVGGPKGGGTKAPKGGKRMRWLPCSLNSCVVR